MKIKDERLGVFSGTNGHICYGIRCHDGRYFLSSSLRFIYYKQKAKKKRKSSSIILTNMKALLNKKSDLNLNLFRRMINKAYWPIYGTIKILEDFDRINFECTNESDCPEKFGAIYSYVLLMAYMIIGNVLLINLLIAMFR